MSAQPATQEETVVAVPRQRAAPVKPPPLENGDHLTREEFERRYWAMPDVNLSPGDTVRLEPNEAGVVCSGVFPGLCLAVGALLESDMATVLAELRKAMQIPEHEAFAQSLQEARSPA